MGEPGAPGGQFSGAWRCAEPVPAPELILSAWQGFVGFVGAVRGGSPNVRRRIKALRLGETTVPIFVPTPCIEGSRAVASALARTSRKPLKTSTLAQFLATVRSTAKLLILHGLLVMDQEVGGSNPLAPTIYPISFHGPTALRQQRGQLRIPNHLRPQHLHLKCLFFFYSPCASRRGRACPARLARRDVQ